MSEILAVLLFVKNNMQMYHWQTQSYARHKASDEFLDTLSSNIDLFMETLQGIRGERVKLSYELTVGNQTDKSIVKLLNDYKNWLVKKLPKLIQTKNTDLLNIRDDMLKDVNKTLYLFTFN